MTLQVPVRFPAIKDISEHFPHLAIDVVRRTADEISAQTAKVISFEIFPFQNPAIVHHIRPPECAALLTATFRLPQANCSNA